jgi:ABC-type lipoprotein export system ATPase subunit
MIQLDHVTKSYATRNGPVRALDEVTLGVEPGEFVAVCGPSGCGKSTLLLVAGGMTSPTSGRVHVAGNSLADLSPSQRAAFRAESIGFVFQMFHLLPYLTVLDNVQAAAISPGEVARRRGCELLERFGLADRLAHRPAELSVGERQRVAMARALLNGPRVLLADEPTGNLDPDNSAVVTGHLREFQQSGGTVLLVTHDSRVAAAAQRVVRMTAGRVIVDSA